LLLILNSIHSFGFYLGRWYDAKLLQHAHKVTFTPAFRHFAIDKAHQGNTGQGYPLAGRRYTVEFALMGHIDVKADGDLISFTNRIIKNQLGIGKPGQKAAVEETSALIPRR
jgi:hypothetical protein